MAGDVSPVAMFIGGLPVSEAWLKEAPLKSGNDQTGLVYIWLGGFPDWLTSILEVLDTNDWHGHSSCHVNVILMNIFVHMWHLVKLKAVAIKAEFLCWL